MDLKRVDDWHLHLTAYPRNPAVARDYAKHCDIVGWKPTVIENMLGGGGTMQELIPTHKAGCELGQALILLHDVGKLFVMSGWIVPRLKIEGRTRHADAMYCETHVVVHDVRGWSGTALSRSLPSGRTYATYRSADASEDAVARCQREAVNAGAIGAKWEWAVYDSNRATDRTWFNSWGMNP